LTDLRWNTCLDLRAAGMSRVRNHSGFEVRVCRDDAFGDVRGPGKALNQRPLVCKSVQPQPQRDRVCDREMEIISRLAAGPGNPEIAKELNFSERTIKYVVSNLVSRFNLQNRTHLVAFAIRNDIV
jgi:DNA-binding CsgD family transcriptional regulator